MMMLGDRMVISSFSSAVYGDVFMSGFDCDDIWWPRQALMILLFFVYQPLHDLASNFFLNMIRRPKKDKNPKATSILEPFSMLFELA